MHKFVDEEVPMDLLPTEGPAYRIPVRMRYDNCDPLAVRLVIPLPDGSTNTWCFARELLFNGVGRPCGEGDVTVSPVGQHDGGAVLIRLRVNEEEALFVTPGDPLKAFLDRTGALVPFGREEHHPCYWWHLDTELDSISRSSR
ncbi:SsgA family sporulation/cell division regulator [Streptomyces sp. NPDC058877]|uniref:SsgA family sporulation/cell division regulator n=1 Tax=unclassified Streptomyces TaxID=2593676 RepID=UPI0036BA1218